MYYTGRLEVFNENFLVVSSLSLTHMNLFMVTNYNDLSNKASKLLTPDFVLLDQADQKLTYALMHCNPQSESNLRYFYCLGFAGLWFDRPWCLDS